MKVHYDNALRLGAPGHDPVPLCSSSPGIEGIEEEPRFLADAALRRLIALTREGLRFIDPAEYSGMDVDV